MTLDKVSNIVELAKGYVDRGVDPSTAISLAYKILIFNEKMLENQLTY